MTRPAGKRSWRPWLLAGGGILVALSIAVAVAASAAGEPLRRYLERRIDESLDGYTVTIGALSLRPLRCAVELGDVTLIQDARPSPPVAYVPAWRIGLDWRALLSLALVADTTLVRPAVYLTLEQTREEARDDTPLAQRGWQRAVEAAVPLEINALRIVDGAVSYYDTGDIPPIELRQVDFEARNIRNVRSASDAHPSPMRLRGELLAGRLAASGRADFLAEPLPRAVAEVTLDDVALVPLAPILRRWDLALRGGTMGAAGRVSFSGEETAIALDRLVVSEPVLEYARGATEGERHVERAVGAAAAAARKPGVRVDVRDARIRGGTLALEIDGVRGADGTVYAAAEELPPLRLERLEVHATDISSQPREHDHPTRFELRGDVLGKAHVAVTGTTALLADPHPTLRADFDLSQVPLAALAPLARRWAFELQGGMLSASGRLDVADGSGVTLRRLVLAQPAITYVERRPVDERRLERVVRAAADAEAKPAFRFDVQDARIRGGTFAFAEERATPPYRLALTRSDVTLRGFSNQSSKRRGNASLRGRFMRSGAASIDATFANGTRRPELDLKVRLESVDLVELNDLLRATGGFDVASGRFSFYSELAVQDGQMKGYVKPFFKDIDVYDRKQDAGKGLGRQAYEAAVGAAGTVLQNPSRGQVATRADISGPIEHPDARTWQLLMGLLRNAFWQALLPGLDRTGAAR